MTSAAAIPLTEAQSARPPLACDNANRTGHGFGHTFKVKVSAAATKVKEAVGTVFKGLAGVISEPCELGRMLRFIGYGLLGLGHATGQPNFMNTLQDRTGHADGILDSTYILGDFSYWLGGGVRKDVTDEDGKFRGDKICSPLGRVAFTVGNIGGVGLLLDSVGLINLGKWAESIGKIPFLGFITKVSLVTVVRAAVGIAYTFFAVDSIMKMIDLKNENSDKKRIHAGFKLLHCIAEVAFKIVVLAGGTAISTIAPLGMLAAGTGVLSYLYHIYNKEAIMKKKAA